MRQACQTNTAAAIFAPKTASKGSVKTSAAVAIASHMRGRRSRRRSSSIAVSKAIENDEDQTIRQYDKVLFDPREAIPVELEHDNRLFVVHIDRVLAIFRRSDADKSRRGKVADRDAADDDETDTPAGGD